MFSKIIFRLFLGFAALCLLAVAFVSTCGWLATQPPQFYQELAQLEYSVEDQKKIRQEMEEFRLLMEAWAKLPKQESVVSHLKTKSSRSKHQSVARYAANSQFIDAGGRVVFSQDNINALISTEQKTKSKIKKPRIMIQGDRMYVASLVEIDDYPEVCLSIEVRPSLTENGKFKVEIIGGKIGRLPIPVQTLMRWAANSSHLGPDLENEKFEFYGDASPVYVVFENDDSPRDFPAVKQIVCRDQRLVIELEQPMIAY